jgi:hypothetical protein
LAKNFEFFFFKNLPPALFPKVMGMGDYDNEILLQTCRFLG